MLHSRLKAALAISAICTMALLGGCATTEQVERAQATADQALSTAQTAQSQAQQAQQTAQAATAASQQAQNAADAAQAAAARAAAAPPQDAAVARAGERGA